LSSSRITPPTDACDRRSRKRGRRRLGVLLPVGVCRVVLVGHEQVAVVEDRLDLVDGQLRVRRVVDGDRRDADAIGRESLVARFGKRVEREPDGLVGCDARFVLRFEVVTEVAAVGTDRQRLPLVGGSGRVSLEQPRLAVLNTADE